MHEKVHELVNEMYSMYQQGTLHDARMKLDQLDTMHKQIDHILILCER